MRFNPWILGRLVVLAALALGADRAHAQQPNLTPEQVRKSIDDGVAYLLDEESDRGEWDDMGQYPGGVSALCTLALLNSGVEPTHPKMKVALDYLRALKPTKTYVVSLRTMALAQGEPRRDLPIIQQDVAWLERVQIDQGEVTGSWSYDDQMGGDNSNSQFAVLALQEAERVGARVSPRVWKRAFDYWEKCQNPDGSWGYHPGEPGTGSMTCAGVGAWVICASKAGRSAARVDGDAVMCCLPPRNDDALDRATSWMARNFSVRQNPGNAGNWHYYFLYGLERFGRLTAHRFIGDHDWYREGCELLVRQQDPFSHFWQGTTTYEDNPQVGTALALLFLSKGRRPVLVANMKHGPGEDWNNHPAALGNLTALCERSWGLDMTWQVVDPQQASVDDLLQTPVLYLSGSRAPELAGLETKVRDYLDRGGFLFAEACCVDSHEFDGSVRQFLARVFPEGEYKLTRAGPEHPLWHIDKLVRTESPYVGRIWTVEYGCRTCVVFCEVDLSCYWELAGRGRNDNLPKDVQQRIDDASAIGLNVLAYATNREPKGKEASFASLDAAATESLGTRGVVRIAKLIHGGGCNDAPGALVNLLRAASAGELQLSISTSPVDLRANDPQLRKFHLAFMHGRHDFRFTPDERESLRGYLQDGGTLFADSICASPHFAAAFRREMTQVLPENPLAPIPATHPLYTDAAGGYNLPLVHRREPVVAAADQPVRSRVQEAPPELEGIELDGRLAVIFSPYDISCALEQHEAQQCRGYTREDAARLGLNVLLYSLAPDGTPPTSTP